jgi:uncharacterized membrane protein YfcA
MSLVCGPPAVTTYGGAVLVIVAAGLIVAFGALVQGTVGFGMSLVAAPLLALVDPGYVPVPLLVLALAHALLTLAREPGETDWRGVRWALLGRLPGTVLGALAVAALPYRGFATLIAVLVLACCAASLATLPYRPTSRALVTAGLFSGVSGTAAAIGGPPVALLYQRQPGPAVRGTLGAYFALGALMSFAALGVGGEIDGGLLRGLALVPWMAVGFAASGPVRHLLDRGWTRPAVLAVSSTSALVLLVQAQVA